MPVTDTPNVSAKPSPPLFRRFDRYGELNRYDLLKVIALVTMVIDHLGFYFWYDSLWMRAIGRMAFPLFLFLVGYSKSWTIHYDLLCCAIFLIALSAVTHHAIFPLNILVTIIFTRMLMEWITATTLSSKKLWLIFIVCAVLVSRTMVLVDYGALAILFALCGYLHREKPASNLTIVYIESTLLLEGVLEYTTFKFHGLTTYIMIIVLVIDMILMNTFKIGALKVQAWPVSLRCIVQWLSRNTLVLYTLHIAVFMVITRVFGHHAGLAHFRWR
jgi:hypothetical protein